MRFGPLRKAAAFASLFLLVFALSLPAFYFTMGTVFYPIVQALFSVVVPIYFAFRWTYWFKRVERLSDAERE